ncbi:MAG: DUF4912 domain-containing protein [Firmicutes bacterium]|nr:DUF4912 domain-containing protein [Bacillota bacterium]
MDTMSWALGLAVILLLLSFFVWRSGAGRKALRQKTAVAEPSEAMPSEMEEYAGELAGDFWLAPPEPQTKIQPPEIPWYYGSDRLVLMVRDPNWLFAYWEITAAKQEQFRRQYGPLAWSVSRPVLRVYDVTGIAFNGANANNYIDFAISDGVDNWHLEVSRPDTSFCVDVGRIFPDGRFVTLLRSNIVHTPGMDFSNLFDEEWMWIEGIYRTVNRLYAGSSPMLRSEAGKEMVVLPVGLSSSAFNGAKH